MAEHPVLVSAKPSAFFERDPILRAIGVTLSILVHAAVAIFLLNGLRDWEFEAEPIEIAVELITLEAPPRPPPTPPPQPVQPTPAEPPVAAPRPAPPPPQLQEAPPAEKSSPPPAPPARARAQPPVETTRRAPADAVPLPTTPAPDAAPVNVARENEAKRSGKAEPASQAVQDFILMQIGRYWIIDFRGPRFRDLVLTGSLVLLPNGMLAPPYGKNDPWDLTLMAPGSEKWPERYRSAAITFLQAARAAQPFRLPPDGKGDQSRLLPLDFRLGDIQR